jgi:RNA polymerase sigma-70 factor (ECF subfamily)
MISHEYGPVVWKTAWRLLGNQADASDCFQETFISALEAAERGAVRNWAGLLQRLATARALDLLRRRKRERSRQASAADWEMVSPENPLRQAQETELMERLRAVLGELPEPQSEAFCLRHLNEMSYEEIAGEMGLSVDHVGVLLHRARGRLRELLASEDVRQEQE